MKEQFVSGNSINFAGGLGERRPGSRVVHGRLSLGPARARSRRQVDRRLGRGHVDLRRPEGGRHGCERYARHSKVCTCELL